MKKRSQEEWRELFARQETSGLSAAEFCKKNDLCPKHFSVRRKQLEWKAGEIETGFVRAQVKNDMKEMDVSGRAVTSLIIHCHAGQLVFGALPQPHWLAQLLKALA